MINLFIGNYHEAARHSDECVRTAVTPYERRMGAITKASAEIFLDDVEGALVRLLEAVGVASQTGWGQMVAFGTISVGAGHVLAGRVGKGIGLRKAPLAPTMRAVKSSMLPSLRLLLRKSIWKC
jgi:hypothetical protein